MTAELPVRSFLLQFTPEIPRFWFDGNIYLTQFMNFNFAILPPLERFVIRHAKKHIQEIKSPGLQMKLDWFIRQEAQHYKAHDDYNHWLDRNDYPVREAIQRTEELLKHLEENYSLCTILRFCSFTEHIFAFRFWWALIGTQRSYIGTLRRSLQKFAHAQAGISFKMNSRQRAK